MAEPVNSWHRPDYKARELHRKSGKKIKHFKGYLTTGELDIAVVEFFQKHHGRISTSMLRSKFLNFRGPSNMLGRTIRRVNEYLRLNEEVCIQRATQDPLPGQSHVYWYEFVSSGKQVMMSMTDRAADCRNRLNKMVDELHFMEEKSRAGLLSEDDRMDFEALKHGIVKMLGSTQEYISTAASRGLLDKNRSAAPTEEDLGHVEPSAEAEEDLDDDIEYGSFSDTRPGPETVNRAEEDKKKDPK